MYLNKNKSDTNIDKEFKNKNDYLSNIIKIINKYRIIIILAIVLVIMLLMIIFFVNNKTINYLILNGEEIITIYQGSDYIEAGFQAYNSKDKDLSKNVTINSTLNTDKIGEYEITYTLNNITKTRKINVIERPKEYTYLYLETVNDDINIYLKVGQSYNEPGYKVFNSSGKNLTEEVKVSGTVNTSKVGNYKIVYSVIDSNNVTVSASRTVIVMDTEISLTLSNQSYTNKDIAINIGIIDNYFDYMILPDNTKVTKSSYSYNVDKNGKYTFIVYNKKGDSKESSIQVNNIDRIAPTGKCSGTYKNGKSSINISANDNIGINRYAINGKSYTSNKITINSELKTVTITIYDKAGNSKNISCNLTSENTETTPNTSNKNITFSYEYQSPSGYMPYALYTPSTASSNKKTPLIIWLHGSGEVGSSGEALNKHGMLYALNNWPLEYFDAYVLAPHLTGNYKGTWQDRRNNLNAVMDKIIKEKNIDTNKIIITGHSMGGLGALYMANNYDYYSALVVYSGYYTNMDNIDIPTIGYVGTPGAGEDKDSYQIMRIHFAPRFKLVELNTGHGGVPYVALTEDSNGDNKSDLIEWMLAQ